MNQDLIGPQAEKTFSWKKWILLGGIFLLVLGFGFVYQRVSGATNKISDSEENTSIFSQIKYVNQEKPLKGQEEDRINVLLLGLGGLNHPGGTLTDTIMVASYKPSTNEMSFISIPRDLVVKVYDDNNPDYWEGRKINYAYELGGMDLVLEKITEVTGLDMNYYVWLDFEGFRKIIDDMGGLDIYVENGFTDYEYPDYNYGYQTIQFTKGWTHMDGETALQFSRSRHGNNGEGSDFARSQRQQKVIESFKDKMFSSSTLLNPMTLNNILGSLSDHLKTNAEVWEMVQGAKMSGEMDKESIISKVIDNGASGLLYSKIADTGAYVLIPNAGEYNFTEIQNMSKNVFETVEITKEEASLEVQNGTNKNGLAAKTAEELRGKDLKVSSIGNALNQEEAKTYIYDLSDGQKPETLTKLQELFSDFEFKSKEEADGLTESGADFLIIIGADYTEVSEEEIEEEYSDEVQTIEKDNSPDTYVL